MNCYNAFPNFNGMNIGMFNPNMVNDFLYKFNELEGRIKMLEKKIENMENNKDNLNYQNPDNSLYMI